MCVFFESVELIDLVERFYLWADSTVTAEKAPVDFGCKWERLEKLQHPIIHFFVIFLAALLFEAELRSDDSGLVVPTQKINVLWKANL